MMNKDESLSETTKPVVSYKYKNLKHVILHGILPGETKEFDHPILGGGIELVEETEKKIKINKKEEPEDKSKDLSHKSFSKHGDD